MEKKQLSYEQRVYDLVSKRKKELVQIQQLLQEPNTRFLNCFAIQTRATSPFEYGGGLNHHLQPLFILGCFIGSVIGFPNNTDKIVIIDMIFDKYLKQFAKNKFKFKTFVIENLPNLALRPPSLDLKIDFKKM